MAFLVAVVLSAAFELTGCSGEGGAAPAPAAVDAADTRFGTAAVTAVIPFTRGLSGSMILRGPRAAAVHISAAQPAAALRAPAGQQPDCPAVPPIVITNPFPFPLTIALDRFRVRLPCSVNGLLFGASTYQSNPIPQTIVSTKLGDATGSGSTLTFTPAAAQLAFPPKSAMTISILPEASTAFTQLPAIPNATTLLTSNVPAVPNSLAFAFPDVQGGTTFQSACYLPNDPAGPGLGGVHVLGTASFYCVLAPGQANATTSFGGANPGDVVTFRLGPNAKPDASLVGLDGPPLLAACTPETGAQICPAPPFAIPVYSKAYVSNDAGMAACAPAVAETDCNGVAGNPKAPGATSVWTGQSFQLLFADDPSYNAANTFGGVTLKIPGQWPACTIVIGPDDNGDAPPGYGDPGTPGAATPLLADFTGAGPYVEFDVKAQHVGTCAVNLTEDTGLKRSFAFTIPVQ